MTLSILCQTQAPTTAASAFTAERPTQVFSAEVCNPSAADDRLSVWLTSSPSDTQVDGNAIYHEVGVPAGATVSLGGLANHVVQTGCKVFLEAQASATALTVTISGRS